MGGLKGAEAKAHERAAERRIQLRDRAAHTHGRAEARPATATAETRDVSERVKSAGTAKTEAELRQEALKPKVGAAEQQARDYQYQQLAGKYPTLDKLFQDPEAWIADVHSRFEAQKKVTPKDPYQFDFSDYSKPVLEQVDKAIEAALDNNDVARMKPGGDTQERREANRYLRKLRAEVKSSIEGGITYRRMIELNYFVTMALGHFQAREYNLRDKVMLHTVDRRLLSYKDLPLAEQERRYDHNEFRIMEGESFDKDLNQHKPGFEADMFHPDQMKMIILPTMEYLEFRPLMRLMPTNVFLIGVTGDPIPSDAAVRTSGDFWNHDMRHSSSTYTKLKWYQQWHQMTPEAMATLRAHSDRWVTELELAQAKIADKDLREAIEFLNFNYHHDRGIPQLPSSFMANEKARTDVALTLYVGLRLSDQPITFKNPRENLAKAEKWLRAFWAPRMEQEMKLWPEGDRPATPETTLQMSSGVEVRGVATGSSFAKDGSLAYLQFSGPTKIGFEGKAIEGQGAERHASGFGTPVGAIKGVKGELSSKDFSKLGLVVGKEASIEMASGVVITGIFKGAVERDGKPVVLTFDAARVTHGPEVLYKPEWGPYDMIVARDLKNIAD